MQIQEHSPNDMLTKCAPVSYDAQARCPLWLACLNTWMDGNQEKINYLQRLDGMCLTGDVSSRVFPIFWGPGLNGKSVHCNTLLGLMGDYATIAPRGFLHHRFYEEHPTEIASLYGVRLVIAQETRPGMKLRSDLVKTMTGDITLKGRFMRQDYFDFKITHHTILMTNNLPIIDDPSDAIWDRVHLVEWPVRIPDDKVDVHLLDKLKSEWPGILNWLIEGCQQWIKDDYQLIPPDAVKTATQQYRKASDQLVGFFDDCCNFEPEVFVPVAALRTAYDSWAKENGIAENEVLKSRTFNERLRAKNCRNAPKWCKNEAGTEKQRKCWIGINLTAKSQGNNENDQGFDENLPI